MQTAGNINWKQSAPLAFSGRINGKEVFWTTIESYGVELFTTLTNAAGENWTDCGGALSMLLCQSQEEAQIKAEEAFLKWLKEMGLEVKKPHRCDTCQKWLDEVCP
jgi:hypothetical protein